MQRHKLFVGLIWAVSSALCSYADDQSDGGPFKSIRTDPPPGRIKGKGFFVGDTCDTECSDVQQHTICNRNSSKCECDPRYPIVVDNAICAPPLKLGDRCQFDQSCKYFDKNTICGPVNDHESECQCRVRFYPSAMLESITRTNICIPEPEGPLLKSDVPTLIGVGVGLSIFTALTCLVLKLFSRARFSQARAYGNAHLPPPALTSTDSKRRCSYNRPASTTDSDMGATYDSPRRNDSLNGHHHHHSGSMRASSGHSHGGRRPSNTSLTAERNKWSRNNSVMRASGANHHSAEIVRETSEVDTMIELQPLSATVTTKTTDRSLGGHYSIQE